MVIPVEDPDRDYLRARRAEDPAVPVHRLLAEIRERGYPASMNLLCRYILDHEVPRQRHRGLGRAERVPATVEVRAVHQSRPARSRTDRAYPRAGLASAAYSASCCPSPGTPDAEPEPGDGGYDDSEQAS
jgi:hypothetical protein